MSTQQPDTITSNTAWWWEYMTLNRGVIETFITTVAKEALTKGNNEDAFKPEDALKSFRIVYKAGNTQKMRTYLNLVWYVAPDTRDVRRVPGFHEVCNLLDGTVPHDNIIEEGEGDGS